MAVVLAIQEEVCSLDSGLIGAVDHIRMGRIPPWEEFMLTVSRRAAR